VGDHSIAYEWGVLAKNLVAGRGYSYYEVLTDGVVRISSMAPGSTPIPSAYMPPLYAFLMAGLLKLLGSDFGAASAVTVIQAILGTATAWLVYRSAELVVSRRAAIWALAVYAVFPLGVYASAQVSAVVLYVFLAQLTLWLLLEWRYGAHSHPRQLAAAGLSAGLLLLARGEALAIVAVFAVWVLVVSDPQVRRPRNLGAIRRLANCACFSLPAIALAVPWTLRNLSAFGTLTSPTASGGYNLWQGQNSNATGIHGGSVTPPVVEGGHLRRLIDALPGTNDYELRRDNLYLHDALQAISADPARSVILGLKKIAMYWTNLYPGVSINYPGAQSPLIVVPWLTIVILAIAGIVGLRRQWLRASIIHLYVITNTLVIAVFFVMPRYNLAVLPCVAIFAAAGIDWLATRPRQHGGVRSSERRTLDKSVLPS
jgi:4-amino-4-deoxy-L-arabinose transferase-like glycosyltransferase